MTHLLDGLGAICGPLRGDCEGEGEGEGLSLSSNSSSGSSLPVVVVATLISGHEVVRE